MSELNEFDKVVQSIVNQTNGVRDDETPNTEKYLEKHLLEIQSELDNEIVDRHNFEQFLKLLLCQSANFTLTFFLISIGMELITSTLVGLFISLIPGVSVFSVLSRKSELNYLPVAVNLGVGLFTSAVIFTSVTVPHIASQNTVKQIYEEIEVIQYGKPQNNVLTNL